MGDLFCLVAFEILLVFSVLYLYYSMSQCGLIYTAWYLVYAVLFLVCRFMVFISPGRFIAIISLYSTPPLFSLFCPFGILVRPMLHLLC